jgi:hypothetical protein
MSYVIEPDFAQSMIAHESAFIHASTDTYNASMTGVLPHGDIASVGQYGLFFGVHRNHQLVIINLAYKMLIVEVTERIYQWLLMIGFFD